MNSYYLGSTVQGNNHSYPVLILHVIPSATVRNFIANFATVEDVMAFGAECIHIKESITHMNERKGSGRINQGEYKESLHQELIPMV